MLILSRREAQCICLGDEIVLTIVAVGKDKVRIGVSAPSGVRILRHELEVEQPVSPPPHSPEGASANSHQIAAAAVAAVASLPFQRPSLLRSRKPPLNVPPLRRSA